MPAHNPLAAEFGTRADTRKGLRVKTRNMHTYSQPCACTHTYKSGATTSSVAPTATPSASSAGVVEDEVAMWRSADVWIAGMLGG